jgi:RNA polymerase sigma-70 factor (ECF subfamily)
MPWAVFIFEGRRTVTEHTLVGDLALMERANEDVIEAAVRDYARLVYRIAYSVLRNHHDAEDATQETFVRVLRYRRKLQGVKDAKTWLAKIAWRVAIQRNGRRHNPSELTMNEAALKQAVAQLPSKMTSAEEYVLGSDMAELLTSLIRALPEPLRDAIRLSTVEELAIDEIAQVLEITESSVRARLFRARQILKERLASLESR